jgi:hypothetical protein
MRIDKKEGVLCQGTWGIESKLAVGWVRVQPKGFLVGAQQRWSSCDLILWLGFCQWQITSEKISFTGLVRGMLP